MILLDRNLRALGILMLLMLAVESGRRIHAADAGPTYSKDVLPIFQKHCNECHHKGGSAPQSFETYKETRAFVRSIKKQIVDKTMPPWHADPAVGKWKNKPEITEAEVKTITTWADAKGPEGEPKDAPPQIDYTKPWHLGQPDQILTAEFFDVPAQAKAPAMGPDLYHTSTLTPNFAGDTWLSGVELAAGAQDVVQQIYLSLTLPDKTTVSNIASMGKGMSLTEMLPKGVGIFVPKGSTFSLLVHYKTMGEPMRDQSKVGLYIAKAAPAKKLMTAVIENKQLDIAANAANQKASAELKLDKAAKIYDILPQMYYAGKSLELNAQKADGKADKLLKLDDTSYDLETQYTPAEPIAVAAGTKLTVSAVYDNSKTNSNNPTAQLKKGAGEAPTGEALRVTVQYTED